MAKLMQVIHILTRRGTGVENDPSRRVEQYWSVDGVLLAEHDEWFEERIRHALKTADVQYEHLADMRLTD